MLRAYSILAYLFLYGPIMLIVLFSFNSGLSAADFQGFSVKWYAKVGGNSLMLAALQTSLIVAFTSAALATLMGTMAALALQRVKGPVRLIFDALTYIAIMVPGIVIGIATLIALVTTFEAANTVLATIWPGDAPLQLHMGYGSIIAALTGITTVSDFRPADMALGGQGAPLVPFADYALYRHPKLGRVSLNIGGIANITVIPANAKPSDVFAFDTGPGNMLIDALVQHFTRGRQRYDKDAAFARQGHLNRKLLAIFLRDPYFKLKPPKSTGREYFGASYIKKILALARQYKLKPNDLVHTVTVFSAASITDALHRFVFPKHKIQQLIVSGGGTQNPLLMSQLAALLMPPARFVIPSNARNLSSAIDVFPSSACNVPTDAKEALAFAILAHEAFHQRPSNIPTATGARGPAILGKISYAPPR